MRLLRHTGVYGLLCCTKQSRRRTKATTSPYFHPFGVALQQGPWTTGVKIVSAAAQFHGIGVARQGPWLTWVNKRKKEGQGLESPSPNGEAVPSLPLLFLLLLLLREEDVADGDVHLGDSQTNQVLNPSYDVPAHSLSYLVDGPTVLDTHAQVHRRLDLTHLHRDAPALALAAYTRHGAHDAPHSLCGGAAHPDALYLLSRHPGNLGDNAVLDRGGAAFSFQRALLVMSAVVSRLCAHADSLLCPTLPTGEFAHPDSVLDPPGASLLLFLGGGLLTVPGSLGQLVPHFLLDPLGARSMVTFGHTLCLPRIAPLSERHVLFGTYNSERCLRASGVSNRW